MRKLKIAVCPIPFPDECAVSVAARAAELNGHINLSSMLRGTGIFYPGEKISILFSKKEKYKKIINFLGLLDTTDRVLERFGLRQKLCIYNGVLLHKKYLREYVSAYCPQCLRESSYWRKHWMLRPYATCHIHNSQLYESCGYCKEPLKEVRSRLCICSECGSDLRKLPVVSGNGLASTWFFDSLQRADQGAVREYLVYFSVFDRLGGHQMDHSKGELFAYFCTNLEVASASDIFFQDARFKTIHPIYFLLPLLTYCQRTRDIANQIMKLLDVSYLNSECSELKFTKKELITLLETDEKSFERLRDCDVIREVKTPPCAKRTKLFVLENFNSLMKLIQQRSTSVIDVLGRLSVLNGDYLTTPQAGRLINSLGYGGRLCTYQICTHRENILGFSVPVIRNAHFCDVVNMLKEKFQ